MEDVRQELEMNEAVVDRNFHNNYWLNKYISFLKPFVSRAEI
jgi:hypothetical protein